MTQSEARRLKLTTTLGEVHAIADRVLGERRARAQRVAAKPVAPGKTKEDRGQERNARAAIIRAEVFARVERERGGRCEWYCDRPATDWHHVLNGGRRRAMERADTSAGICRGCHRGYERGDTDVLRSAGTWAVEHGFREAAREICHRKDKVEEARRASTGGTR